MKKYLLDITADEEELVEEAHHVELYILTSTSGASVPEVHDDYQTAYSSMEQRCKEAVEQLLDEPVPADSEDVAPVIHLKGRSAEVSFRGKRVQFKLDKVAYTPSVHTNGIQKTEPRTILVQRFGRVTVDLPIGTPEPEGVKLAKSVDHSRICWDDKVDFLCYDDYPDEMFNLTEEELEEATGETSKKPTPTTSLPRYDLDVVLGYIDRKVPGFMEAAWNRLADLGYIINDSTTAINWDMVLKDTGSDKEIESLLKNGVDLMMDCFPDIATGEVDFNICW